MNEIRSLVERDIDGQVSFGCRGQQIEHCTTYLQTVISVVISIFTSNTPNYCT